MRYLWLKACGISALLIMAAFGQAAHAATGRTSGEFNVSSTGAATYQIPISVPAGPKGIQPNLAITYNSQVGDTILGVGWNLSGLSAITRCNKTYSQDGAAAAVTLSTSDGYCLNGNRLRLQTGTYGTAGSTYFTELADFSRITANGTAGNGPQSFTVEGKDGLIYEYGTTVDSRIIPGRLSTVTPYQWLLNKVRDRAGNNYAVTYNAGAGDSWSGIAVPASISYTAVSAGSASYSYSVNFSYITRISQNSNTRLTTISTYIADTAGNGGYQNSNVNLLSTISVSAGGTLVHKYALTYDNGVTTTAARLKTITECAGSAGTDCLSPTTITYQEGSQGTNSTAVIVATNATAVLAARDFNGDGRDDILYRASGNALYVSYASTSGYGTPVALGVTFPQPPLGYTTIQFADMFAAGRTDIMLPLNGVWWRYSWSGNALVGTSTGITYVSQYLGLWRDINGDGLPDLIYGETNNNYFSIKSRLNTSSGGVFSLSATVNSTPQMIVFSCDGWCWNSYQLTDAFSTPSSFYVRPTNTSSNKAATDINGDGRADVILSWSVSYYDSNTLAYVLSSQGSYAMLSNGVSFTTGPATDNFKDFVDLNDDNCSDYISGLSSYSAIITDCRGAVGATISVGYPSLGVVDWDGDGRQDVLVNTGTYVGVRYSTGTGLSPVVVTAIPVSKNFILDANGDGAWDIGSLAASTISYNLHTVVGQNPPDVLASITDGYGVTSTPTYVSLVQSDYAGGSSPTFPEQVEPGPLTVVGWVSTADGIGGTYTKTYSYQGARRDSQGRGLEGFQTVTVTDSRANTSVVKTYYKTAFPYTGMVYQQEVCQHIDVLCQNVSGTTLISHTVNTPSTLVVSTLDATLNNQRYFPYIATSSTETYEVNASGVKNGSLITQSAATYLYDSYGNLTSSTTTVTDKDSGAPTSPTYNQIWTKVVINTITPNTANWCLSIPTKTTVQQYATSVSSITRTSSFTPDYLKCRITQQITEPFSAAYKVTTDYYYDNFGNINSQIVTGSYDPATGAAMPARTTLVNWGTTGQFPENTTNAEGHFAQAGYNYNLGVQASQTDPNGLITSWTYDNFGRKLTETRPDGTWTAYSYNDCTSVSGGCQNGDPAGSTSINKMVVIATLKNTAGTAIRDDWTYLDQFDRTIVTKSKTLPMASGSTYSRIGVQYDALGRVYRQTAPCDASSCTVYWTTNTYDAMGRLTAQSRPINGTLQMTTVVYQGMTTITTDPRSKASTKITDPNGWMRRSKDHDGYYQNFDYDAFGSLVGVDDSQGNPLFRATYDYGINAFQRRTNDIDLGQVNLSDLMQGAWLYNYNALGEVTSYADAKGSAFTMTYDKLSRPLTRFVSGEGTTIWTWGNTAANYNIGKLQSLASLGYTENSYYDNKSRLAVKDTITDTTYRYTYTYEATTGLLSTIVYPTSTLSYRLNVQYLYQSGLLQKVRNFGTSALYWQADAMNPLGEITKETLGNGIVTNRSFDGVTGWLNSIQAGVGGGTGVQNESYLFDNVGNVTQRQAWYGSTALTESFCYDNINRLVKSALSGDNSCTTSNNLTVAYDQLGRITNRTDIASNATWTYHATKKHAVTQAGSSAYTYSYDANGNAITRNGYGIIWSKYNYPTEINGPSEKITLSYDANNQRWKQVYVNGATTETTMYAGGLFEKVTTGSVIDYRHYIYADNELVGVLSRSGTSATLRYALSDHQGSMDKITDSSGAVTVSENFNAFGARRNASTWSGSPTSTDLTTINGLSRQGYTGQDALGNLGLNHMNGRVQDAITGRFLSADPYITEPGNTQNYNRYSYVYNNPLSYIDPSGFDAVCPNRDPEIQHFCDLEDVPITAPPKEPPPSCAFDCFETPPSAPGGTTAGPQSQYPDAIQPLYPEALFLRPVKILTSISNLFKSKPAAKDAKLKEQLSSKASQLAKWAESQGWKRTKTENGPVKYVDENDVVRVTLKSGSERTPGSESPHVEFRDASGQRIDPSGNPVTRSSPGNHTPIEWDLE